jgi:hypothetical protein
MPSTNGIIRAGELLTEMKARVDPFADTARLAQRFHVEKRKSPNPRLKSTWHVTWRWGPQCRGRNVPLDRRRASRTRHLVAKTFGVGHCRTVAPPALGDTQQGKAAAPGWNAAAQSFRQCRGSKPAKAATAAKQDHAAALLMCHDSPGPAVLDLTIFSVTIKPSRRPHHDDERRLQNDEELRSSLSTDPARRCWWLPVLSRPVWNHHSALPEFPDRPDCHGQERRRGSVGHVRASAVPASRLPLLATLVRRQASR